MKDDAPIQVGQLSIRYLVDGSSTGKPGLFELGVPPGARVPPPHSHDNNDEYIYVLEGVLRYRVGDEVRELHPGQAMVSPRGKVHAFSNPGTVYTKALVTQYPDLGPQYFRDIAQILGVSGPPNPALIAQVMARYGLVPELPSGA
ncbi:cupin domain-containing protein [Paucibacter sp. DJ2R-2]|uniref:cupin domain-containing protein n=1 Tax=Paucibacter sp. DJ2R-2 TaxID=2893558 RepID=UPI0021E46305|nr:cupin domain-containing protein [Paucibacter sp. DJ2R-2]MCV2422697.1 cupin domain-containing protein [Paucibacter sp. DJ4R-1]MCV2441142.1 cupin domain-containing protein [Paucibacter sp. DJ2R-2]